MTCTAPHLDSPPWPAPAQRLCLLLLAAALLLSPAALVGSRHLGSTLNTFYSASTQRNYGYAPDGRVSWAARAAISGAVSALENGRGDAFNYSADGSLHYGSRDVAVAAGFPAVGSPTADSQVSTGSVSYSSTDPTSYGFTYNYDAAGNRTSAAQLGQPTVTYADNGQGQDQYASFQYDSLANALGAAVGWQYAYDAAGQLTYAINSGYTQSYGLAYDGLGRLVSQITNGVASYFYYAGAQRIEERDSNNHVTATNYYDAPGSAQLTLRKDSTFGDLWYQTDALGNTTHISNDAGQIVEQYAYDPFGTPSCYDALGNARAASAYHNPYLFKSSAGYEWLPAAGLYHCGARYYLPQHGRWLQPDPIGQAGGLNLYAYCHNDPINGVDPSGLADDDAPPVVVQSSGDADTAPPSSITDTGTPPTINTGDGHSSTGPFLPPRGPGSSTAPPDPASASPEYTLGPVTTNVHDPAITWGAPVPPPPPAAPLALSWAATPRRSKIPPWPPKPSV